MDTIFYSIFSMIYYHFDDQDVDKYKNKYRIHIFLTNKFTKITHHLT